MSGTSSGNRRFHVWFLVVTLLVAALLSGFASANPDGLEYVAGKVGFLDTAQDHDAADGPLADYSVKGVDDERLSTGVAGVIGSVVTLLLAGGLAMLLRRRRDDPAER